MDHKVLGFVLLAYFAAAFQKGITGLGFSTLCLPILTLILEPAVSIPLVILPSLTSNSLVMIQAGRFRDAIGRFWPVYLSALPGLLIGVRILTRVDASTVRTVLGVVLMAYSLWALASRVLLLPPRCERRLLAPVGFVTGLINGTTGSQVMPVLPFLLSLGLEKNLFIQAINLSFTCSSIAMLLLLNKAGLLTGEGIRVSLMGVIPVACGIFLGGKIRGMLKEGLYRRIVLVFLLIVGVVLIVR